MNEYWEGHHTEPFSEYWHNPELLKDYEWKHDYYVTSISCPYYRDKKPHTPRYQEFLDAVPIKKEIAIIGRDPTILHHQQVRVRGEDTLDLESLDLLPNPHFISTELLFLYREKYMKYLSRLLDFPVTDNTDDINDSNRKYISAVGMQWLDAKIKKASLEDS